LNKVLLGSEAYGLACSLLRGAEKRPAICPVAAAPLQVIRG